MLSSTRVWLVLVLGCLLREFGRVRGCAQRGLREGNMEYTDGELAARVGVYLGL